MNQVAWIIAASLLMTFAGSVLADEATPPTPAPAPTTSTRTSTVGGGVSNPWRPPYKTAAAPAPMMDSMH